MSIEPIIFITMRRILQMYKPVEEMFVLGDDSEVVRKYFHSKCYSTPANFSAWVISPGLVSIRDDDTNKYFTYSGDFFIDWK